MASERRTVASVAGWADDRLGCPRRRKYLRKVFPDHWSFMLGEIALWSFVVLLLTGVFLTLWFTPSMSESTYEGSYAQLRGVPMSDAYASTLHISFDVRGGLLVRQIHHWAAMVFIAGMLIHLIRVFVTGAFRKPREVTWLIGGTMLLLGVLEGFAGYSLPDDLLSGTGLRIADGLIKATPVVGSYLSFFCSAASSPATTSSPSLHRARAADPGPAAGAGGRAPVPDRLPQAHPVGRARTRRGATSSATRSCRCTSPSRRASSSWSSASSR